MKQLCSHFTDAVDVPISQNNNKIKCVTMPLHSVHFSI